MHQSILLLRSNGNRGAGKQPASLMVVFSVLEFSEQPRRNSGSGGTSPAGRNQRLPVTHSVLDDGLPKMWEDTLHRQTVWSRVRDEGYTDPSSVQMSEVQTSFSEKPFLKLTVSLKVAILRASLSPLFVRQVGSPWLNQNRVNESARSPETTCEILILALEGPLEINFLNSRF